METIYSRRSIRKYLDKKIDEDIITELLKAAMAAPSAGNQQPWEYYVVTNKELIMKLSQVTPYTKCAANAPVVLVPCYRTNGLRFPEYAHIDMSASVENVLLEATHHGLGSVWMGIAPHQDRQNEVNKLLALPENLQAFALIAVGYPDEHKEAQTRFEETRVHYL